jgi:lipopolysaccharide export system protein LptA
MRNGVERLRIWLLGSAVFLMLVIAAFLGSARYLRRHRLALPARLGINIVSETDGYTVSQWDDAKKRTLFTIHAAKEVEHSDKQFTLHDVSIALYGENQDRNDRIYGDEFEYDQKAGVVRAIGLVNLDLQSAQPSGGHAAGSSNAKVLHVTTSNLVYLQKLGVAATNESIEFQSGAMTGHATGADYNSDTGVLTMHSSVSMSGVAGKRPVDVSAAAAEVDNRNQQIFLTGARCVSLGQSVEAQHATLHTRPDGTLARVEAQGNVTRMVKDSKLVSQRADVVLNAKSQPQSAVLTDGVQYSSDLPLLQRSGQAEGATIAFDAQGQAKNAVFTGAVHMSERTRATVAVREPWSSRDLTAAKVEAALHPVSGGPAQVREVVATGSARLTALNNGTLASSKDTGRDEISADVLTVHMVGAGDGRQPPQLDTLAGRGHTVLHQVSADGIEQTSSGDTLDAKFRSQPAASGVVGRQPSLTALGGATGMLLSAVQQGHVTMVRRAPAKVGAKAAANSGTAQEDVQHASAQRVAYDGNLDRVTLTGSVQMSEVGSSLWAGQVVFDRKTGDAQASGTVKVDYAQDASSPANKTQADPAEPTHIIADNAVLVHATGVATFAGSPVRLWQGGSQVQAPVIEIARAQQLLTARGVTSARGATTQKIAQVHTILSPSSDQPGAANSAAANSSAAKTGSRNAGAESQMPKVMRIASGELVYSGDLRQAEFTGGVRAETMDGTVRANQATVYMQQGAGKGPSSAVEEAPSLAGSVERMVATGQIEIEQPGRRATGQRLQYTANDQLFVLTGDDTVLPMLVDAAHGTIAGAAILFHPGDDNVVVSNTEPGATSAEQGRRVRTETHASKDATMEKGK